MDTTDFVTVDHILADALVFCGDESMKKRSKGWYTSQIQQALEDLSIDTYFDERTIDLPFDKVKLQLELPPNFFNLKEVYLWSGECCTPETWQIVHYKIRYNNKPGKGGPVGTSRRSDQNHVNDAFFNPFRKHGLTHTNNLFYANMQNGVLMFSSNSATYDMVRIVGNGFGGAIGDLPIIPRFMRQAAVDYVTERFFRAEMATDNTFIKNWQIADSRLNKEFDGSWAKAEYRAKNMNSWERDGILEYMSEINA